MYDSDDVRDAVRQEALSVFMRWGTSVQGYGYAGVPQIDIAAINEALNAVGNPWQRALREYLEKVSSRPEMDKFERISTVILAWARALADELAELFEPLISALRQLSDETMSALRDVMQCLGSDEPDDPLPFIWQRRQRRPDVWPAHGVDAVAAGRHPAALFRARRIGGRR